MNHQKAQYLLSLLYAKATPSQKEILGGLYSEIGRESQEFQTLFRLVQTVRELSPMGADLKQQASDTLTRVVSDMDHGVGAVKDMGVLTQRITQELNQSNELLSGAAYFTKGINLVDVGDVNGYQAFYKWLACGICYYLTSLHGVSAIKELTYNRKAFLYQLIQLFHDVYAETLMNAPLNGTYGVWTLTKTSYVSGNLIDYTAYNIAYGKASLPVDNEGYRAISPYLYLQTGIKTMPELVGQGYLVGTGVDQALSLLEGTIITALPEDVFGDDDIDFSNLLGVIAEKLGTNCYCISPESLVAALNRWRLHITVAQRIQKQQCLFCGGAPRFGTNDCGKHIAIKA